MTLNANRGGWYTSYLRTVPSGVVWAGLRGKKTCLYNNDNAVRWRTFSFLFLMIDVRQPPQHTRRPAFVLIDDFSPMGRSKSNKPRGQRRRRWWRRSETQIGYVEIEDLATDNKYYRDIRLVFYEIVGKYTQVVPNTTVCNYTYDAFRRGRCRAIFNCFLSEGHTLL